MSRRIEMIQFVKEMVPIYRNQYLWRNVFKETVQIRIRQTRINYSLRKATADMRTS